MDNIGQRLREERQLRGWSQRDLARETGVNVDTISGLETGQHEPRPSTLRKLAKGLEIEVRDLFAEPTLSGKAKAPATGPRPGEASELPEELETLWRMMLGPGRTTGQTELEAQLSELSYQEFMDWADSKPLEFIEMLPERLSENLSPARRGYLVHAAQWRRVRQDFEKARQELIREEATHAE